MRREPAACQAIFDLPVRKWFVPDPELDFSAVHFGRRAATPIGPAAGPHTQLAQNIVLAWLAGSRIIELKTVQVNDRLTIPRPCIHVPNVGLNVEWSQELLVEQSALEYAKAAYLIAILKSTRAFGVLDAASEADLDTIFDISVGYDLDGIRSSKVTRFLDALRHPEPLYDELRGQLTGDLAAYREVPLPAPISDCVTLSTFHGCPADQIEAIARYLLEGRGLHTIIKLNPTLLGFHEVRHILHEQLGYTQFSLRYEAFEQDLQYAECLDILWSLREVAERRGSTIGAKFTNTLVVANESAVFPAQADPYMYLSGPPLHVISMNLMQRVREDVGFEFPVSFSAGIDARNVAAAVACGMVPVTTCTDLLRQGGYGRLPAYLRGLSREMERVGVTSREAYVLSAFGNAVPAAREAMEQVDASGALWEREGRRVGQIAAERPDDMPGLLRELAAAEGVDADALVLSATRIAGRLNGRNIVPVLANEPRYHAESNAKAPRQIDSTLALYDCINCDLCIAACPNDAIFAYEATPRDVSTVRLVPKGGRFEQLSGAGFHIREAHQLAILEGACNACSNCEVYCPEDGAPFAVKEMVFLTRADFERCADVDGFCREGSALHARLGGTEFVMELHTAGNGASLTGGGFDLRVRPDTGEVIGGSVGGSAAPFDTALLWRMTTAWDSIFMSQAPNAVNPEGGA
ncbi:MAG: 4Fe-4S dicluster domain-containing protein [Gemmatimonadota bacterium]|nr:4Fe-4S dicluster domain-containing protein [Gemmatimonadota bacterium]